MGRISLNKTDETRESKIAPGYLKEPNNGAYGIVTSNGLERNLDGLATYTESWSDFTLNVSRVEISSIPLFKHEQFIENRSRTSCSQCIYHPEY